MNIAWRKVLLDSGATIGAHAGVPACVAFAGEACATSIADLSHQGVLAVRGPDAAKFLQGYLTCDVAQLHEAPQEGALCNLQGRMITNFLAIAQGDGVLLRMHRSLVDATRAVLAKYIVFSKAKLTDESDRWQRIGIAGPAAEGLIAQQLAQTGHRDDLAAPAARPPGATVPDTTLSRTAQSDTHTVALALTEGSRYELWLPPAIAAQAWTTLTRSAHPISVWRWEGMDIQAGRAWVTAATAGEYLPQMFNLDTRGAISFTKGCYLGQEIVTRAQHRGGVKRRLARGRLSPCGVNAGTAGVHIDTAGVSIGDVVQLNAKDVGEVVAVGLTDAPEALAVLSLSALRSATAGAGLTVGSASFTLLKLPYPVDN